MVIEKIFLYIIDIALSSLHIILYCKRVHHNK